MAEIRTRHLGYALHFDTGMNRLGLRHVRASGESVAQTSRSPASPCHEPSGLRRSSQTSEINGLQLQRFPGHPTRSSRSSKASLSSTGGIYLGTEYHFDILRPGIGLYGGGPARPSRPEAYALHSP